MYFNPVLQSNVMEDYPQLLAYTGMDSSIMMKKIHLFNYLDGVLPSKTRLTVDGICVYHSQLSQLKLYITSKDEN